MSSDCTLYFCRRLFKTFRTCRRLCLFVFHYVIRYLFVFVEFTGNILRFQTPSQNLIQVNGNQVMGPKSSPLMRFINIDS